MFAHYGGQAHYAFLIYAGTIRHITMVSYIDMYDISDDVILEILDTYCEYRTHAHIYCQYDLFRDRDLYSPLLLSPALPALPNPLPNPHHNPHQPKP